MLQEEALHINAPRKVIDFEQLPFLGAFPPPFSACCKLFGEVSRLLNEPVVSWPPHFKAVSTLRCRAIPLTNELSDVVNFERFKHVLVWLRRISLQTHLSAHSRRKLDELKRKIETLLQILADKSHDFIFEEWPAMLIWKPQALPVPCALEPSIVGPRFALLYRLDPVGVISNQVL